MEKLKKLLEARKASIEKMETLKNTVEGEKRSLTPDEKTQWDTIKSEIAKFDEQINLEKEVEEARSKDFKLNFVSKIGDKEENLRSKFDLSKALRESQSGNYTGAEKEMHEEGVKEYSRSNANPSGLVLPSSYVRSVYTTSSNGNGFTQTSVQGFQNLNDQLLFPKLGIKIIDGLVGNVKLPAGKAVAVVGTENTNNSDSTADNQYVELTPQFIYHNAEITKQTLAAGNNAALESQLQDWILGLDRGLEKHLFGKVGALVVPASISATTATTYSTIATLESEISNGLVSGFVMGRSAKSFLQTKSVDSGSGRFVLDMGTIMGIPAYVSEHLSTKHIYAGDWVSGAKAGWHTGIEITVDPYTKANYGNVKYTISRMGDAGIYSGSFAAFKNVQ